MVSDARAVRVSIAVLTLSAAGLVGLTASESYTDRAVIPVKGDRATLGFGSTDGVKMGDTTTPPRALARVLQDVDKRTIKRCVTSPLFQYEYDAYQSLAFNIGITAFCGSTLVKKLNALDYVGACIAISSWDKFNGLPLPGLTTRRARERAQCEGK